MEISPTFQNISFPVVNIGYINIRPNGLQWVKSPVAENQISLEGRNWSSTSEGEGELEKIHCTQFDSKSFKFCFRKSNESNTKKFQLTFRQSHCFNPLGSQGSITIQIWKIIQTIFRHWTILRIYEILIEIYNAVISKNYEIAQNLVGVL